MSEFTIRFCNCGTAIDVRRPDGARMDVAEGTVKMVTLPPYRGLPASGGITARTSSVSTEELAMFLGIDPAILSKSYPSGCIALDRHQICDLGEWFRSYVERRNRERWRAKRSSELRRLLRRLRRGRAA